MTERGTGTGADRIVSAALDQLDASGLDGLTMRRVAERLGVQLNTVYWHVTGKPALLEMMADALLADCARDLPPAPWPDRVRTLATRLRDGLLSRRDGARLVGPTLPTGPHGTAVTDALTRTFTAAGFDGPTGSAATLLTVHAVTGLAHDAGSAPAAGDESLAFVLDVLVDGFAAHAHGTSAGVAHGDDDLARRLRPPPPATRRPRQARRIRSEPTDDATGPP